MKDPSDLNRHPITTTAADLREARVSGSGPVTCSVFPQGTCHGSSLTHQFPHLLQSLPLKKVKVKSRAAGLLSWYLSKAHQLCPYSMAPPYRRESLGLAWPRLLKKPVSGPDRGFCCMAYLPEASHFYWLITGRPESVTGFCTK